MTLIIIAVVIIAYLLREDYMNKVIRHVDKEMFDDRVDELFEKIQNARCENDCLRIYSNIVALDKKYRKLIDQQSFMASIEKLWKRLDLRYRHIELLKRTELGTLTTADFL